MHMLYYMLPALLSAAAAAASLRSARRPLALMIAVTRAAKYVFGTSIGTR
jgi:hypothetical protein